MPFIIYAIEANDDTVDFKRLRIVSGLSSTIGSFVSEHAPIGGGAPLPWHMSGSDIIQRVGGSPSEHAFVIDLKPSAKNNVSLYQLNDIWGFSYPHWTPLALRLETLFVDEYSEGPEEFKEHFVVPDSRRELVHEFLYLCAGTAGGTWRWGMAGAVNGALLWPDALNYFIQQIS